MTEITVTYERKFSDGHFGSESLSLSWTYEETPMDKEIGFDESVAAAVEMVRSAVLTELSHSGSEGVRWAANRELHGSDPKSERDEVAIATDGEETSLEDLPFG